MFQEENEEYNPYAYPTSYYSSSSGIVDATTDEQANEHTDAQAQTEHLLSQPPTYPPNTNSLLTPPPPKKRRSRAGLIVLLMLMLALIFGVGLLAGRSSTSTGSSTTVNTAATTSATSSVSTGSTIEVQREAAIAKIEPAVVELQVTTAQGTQIGSGVIIDTKGDIITNNHVISGAQTVTALLYNGKSEQAQVIGAVAADDLAIVRIQPFANMTVAKIGDSSKLVVGQEVLAIGNPLGITETATEGIVSALNRSIPESSSTTISQAIQTSAALNPGNSGGALINLQGELVGIPTLSAVNTESNTAASGLNFAIPSNQVLTVIQQLVQ